MDFKKYAEDAIIMVMQMIQYNIKNGKGDICDFSINNYKDVKERMLFKFENTDKYKIKSYNQLLNLNTNITLKDIYDNKFYKTLITGVKKAMIEEEL